MKIKNFVHHNFEMASKEKMTISAENRPEFIISLLIERIQLILY